MHPESKQGGSVKRAFGFDLGKMAFDITQKAEGAAGAAAVTLYVNPLSQSSILAIDICPCCTARTRDC